MAQTVLLGLLDEEVGNEETSYMVNKIGGSPDFMTRCDPVKCVACGRDQLLVSQIYCPLDGSDQHRTLYVFACTQKTCWNKQTSWRVLRCQVKDDSYKTNDKLKVSGTMETALDDWGMGADDWGDCKATNWGSDANNWGDDNKIDPLPNQQAFEAEVANNQPYCLNTVEDKYPGKHGLNNDVKNEWTVKECWSDTVKREENLISDENKCAEMFQSGEDSSSTPTVEDKRETQIINKLEDMNIDSDNANALNQDETAIDLKHTSALKYLNIEDKNKTSDSKCGTEKANVETEPVHSANGDSVHIRGYYVNVIEEPVETSHVFSHEEKLLREYAQTADVDFNIDCLEERSAKSSKRENYEKSSVPHGDKVFQKFMKRISRCPEQILRYKYGGTELPIRPTSNELIPKCKACGSGRVFELQLMPALVSFLQTSNSKESILEFGTVFVYTCKSSCWLSQATAVEEYVVVQADPDQHLFRT